MNPNPEEKWMLLAEAARRTPPANRQPDPSREEIRQRLPAIQAAIRQWILTLLWKRWSWIAIILGLLAYAIAHFALRPDATPPPDRPAIPLPSAP